MTLPTMNRNATQFPELNTLLVELAERTRMILGGNFVGAYLQGSFAVGDADMASDCDFLIPVRGRITPEQEAALRSLHREFPERPEHWAKHLEGSYPDKDELRTLTGLGKEWLYIDHGWSEMQWSTHCNTEVVRWSLRECGGTIIGPEPRTLVDEVSADVLRAKMREEVRDLIPHLNHWTSLSIAWSQRYAVTTLCRILQTFESGRITSKRAALLWGRESLDLEWAPLIQRALDGRAAFWNEPARPEDIEKTTAFAEYAKRRVLG